MKVEETVNASGKLGRETAIKLAKAATVVTVAKGRKLASFSMKNNPPDEATILTHLLGPTGNLRAPTIVCGKTLLVGFNEDVYRETLQ